jgi:predicted glycosyltransferase
MREIADLENEMAEAAEQEEFEKVGLYFDSVFFLSKPFYFIYRLKNFWT